VLVLFVLRKPYYTNILPQPKVYLRPPTPKPIKNCFVKLIHSLINKAKMICPAEIVFWKNVLVTRHTQPLFVFVVVATFLFLS
jgi:hypothetical protein